MQEVAVTELTRNYGGAGEGKAIERSLHNDESRKRFIECGWTVVFYVDGTYSTDTIRRPLDG